MSAIILPPTPVALARAASLLREGALVAFPTETVYGLGVDAASDRATAALFAAKGRPQFNPLIVHVASSAQAEEIALFDDRARILASAFWPGPLTLVLPRRSNAAVSLLVSAGLDTVAIRMPDHPVARRLLEAFGRPIAAPSANRSGSVSPTTPAHVADSLGDRISMILAAGRCAVGVESTILDLTGPIPHLLRFGAVIAEQMQAALGGALIASPSSLVTADRSDFRPIAPGQLSRHYAPSTPVRLNAEFAGPDEALLTFGPDHFVRGGVERLNLSSGGDLHEAAANLFAMLRALDVPGRASIAVVPIPEVGLGLAINDRLRRAAAPPDEV
ncbi:Threonylcarbamoyl-AMP synthase [Azospirillaceae bacterium]